MKDELITQTAPYISTISNGIQLRVHENDIEKAVEILQKKGYMIPKVEPKNNNILTATIFIVAMLVALLIFLWLKKKL